MNEVNNENNQPESQQEVTNVQPQPEQPRNTGNQLSNQPSNNNKKSSSILKTLIICITIIVVVALIGLVVFLLKGNSRPNESKLDNNTPKTEETTDNTGNKPTEDVVVKKYENYVSDELPLSGDETIKLQIVEGILKATIGNKEIKINGIDSKVKSFTYGHDCGGHFEILVLDTNNHVYTFNYDANDSKPFDVISFKQIDTKENIVDITKFPEIGWTTCGEPYLAVVLNNKEIRAVYTDEQNNKKIGTFNYGIIKETFLPIIIYEDNTISKYYVENKYNAKVNDKIKYNNNNIVVDKFIHIETNEYTKYFSYIVSNKKLYKLELKIDGPMINSLNVTLVNNSNIKNESLEVNKGKNEYVYYDEAYDKQIDEKKTNIITFTDGSKEIINNIDSVYSVK